MAVPNGLPTLVWFEWGKVGGYGGATPPVPAGEGFETVFSSADASGLPARSDFQYRMVASNSLGVAYGAPRLFTTGRQVSSWGFWYYGQTTPQPWLTNAVEVAAGMYFSLALNVDGRITHWGRTYPNLDQVPVAATNVIQLACGYEHASALSSSGLVTCWGKSFDGCTTPPPDLNDAVLISTFQYHNLALRRNGTVRAWGTLNDWSVPSGLSNVVGIACGDAHNLALKADGTVTGWGAGTNGQLNIPAGLREVVAICAGAGFSVALKSDRTVSAWGEYYANSAYHPMVVPEGLSNVVAIAAGNHHALALLADGSVVVWGGTDWLQADTPPGLNGAIALAAGGWHSTALIDAVPQALSKSVTNEANANITITLQASDANGDSLAYDVRSLPTAGTLYQFTSGGHGSVISSAGTPVTDSGARIIYAPATNAWGTPFDTFEYGAQDRFSTSSPAIVTIYVTAHAPLVYTRRPTIRGANKAFLNGSVLAGPLDTTTWFELGSEGFVSNVTSGVTQKANRKVDATSAYITGLDPTSSYFYRIASSNLYGVSRGNWVRFSTAGRLAGWGGNSLSQLPVPAGSINVVQVAVGQSHAVALLNNQTLLLWGDMVSFGRTNTSIAPDLTNIVQVACGADYSLALRSDGRVAAWGGGGGYQPTNVPSGLSNVVAVAAGRETSVALQSDGTITNWGYRSLLAFSNVVAIAFAEYSGLVLKIDGTVNSWGSGQIPVPAGLNRVISIATGPYHALAARSDGTVVAWGWNNNFGQTNVPVGLSNVTAVACGREHSLALQMDGTVVAWGNTNAGRTTVPGGLTAFEIACGSSNSFSVGPNVPAQAQPVAATGTMNEDCVLVLGGTDPNNDPVMRRIVSVPAGGLLFQYANGARGELLEPGTVVSDPPGRVIFAPELNQTGWPYTTFDYSAGDGWAGPSRANATLNIIPTPLISAENMAFTADRAFSFSFAGLSNASYRVWGSTNLFAWTPLGHATQSPPEIFSYVDFGATNRPLRFYRITSP